MDTKIEGLVVTPLKQIYGEKGSVYHALKASENTFNGFGEAYFSFVDKNVIKGWKKHNRMLLNLIVPIGEVEFFIHDLRESSPTKGNSFKIRLSNENYNRLTIEPGLWFAFKGIGETNLILDITDIEHDPTEAETKELSEFNFF